MTSARRCNCGCAWACRRPLSRPPSLRPRSSTGPRAGRRGRRWPGVRPGLGGGGWWGRQRRGRCSLPLEQHQIASREGHLRLEGIDEAGFRGQWAGRVQHHFPRLAPEQGGQGEVDRLLPGVEQQIEGVVAYLLAPPIQEIRNGVAVQNTPRDLANPERQSASVIGLPSGRNQPMLTRPHRGRGHALTVPSYRPWQEPVA